MQLPKLLWTILLPFLLAGQLAAQSWPRLDTLYTSPANPSPVDSIMLIYQITHNYSVGTINQQLLPVNNIYSLNVCQAPGIAAVIDTFRDTTMLPPRPVGTYQVNFTLVQGYWYSNISYCQSNGGTFLQGNHSFTVSPILDVNTLLKESLQFSPNPVGALPLHITSTIPITGVQCYHSSGALVQEQTMEATYNYNLSLEKQVAGLYYVVVQTAQGNYTQKIVKQ